MYKKHNAKQSKLKEFKLSAVYFEYKNVMFAQTVLCNVIVLFFFSLFRFIFYKKLQFFHFRPSVILHSSLRACPDPY